MSDVKRLLAVYRQANKRIAERYVLAEEHECDPGWSYASFDERNADDREVIADAAAGLIGPLVAFVQQVAELRRDGEGAGVLQPLVDQAALHSLIGQARALLGRDE